MSARTIPTESFTNRSHLRAGVVAAFALALILGTVLPAAAFAGPNNIDAFAEPSPEPGVSGSSTIPSSQEMPRYLDGDTELDRFENSWQTGYSSLEAAMIANSVDRDLMPAIPEDSGAGKRVVYSLSRQRVWMVADDGYMIDSYLVSGRDWMPNVGTFHVWGKAPRTSGYDPSYTMNWMVRFAVGSHGGNIGFHDLPNYNGRPVQTTAELGQPLSGGCVRQDPYHARMMYAWTEIGTTVVVVP